MKSKERYAIMLRMIGIVLLSVSLVFVIGCDNGGGSSNSNDLASGNTVINGGGTKMATVTAPSSGSLQFVVTRTSGGTNAVVGLSADILQNGTTLAHKSTTESSVTVRTSVVAGENYDLYASASDNDVSITYSAGME
jgi:ABC-type molybdate transport system substrate-binding protein